MQKKSGATKGWRNSLDEIFHNPKHPKSRSFKLALYITIVAIIFLQCLSSLDGVFKRYGNVLAGI